MALRPRKPRPRARTAGAAPIDFRVETVAEMSMRIPRGWARQQDAYILIRPADPNSADSRSDGALCGGGAAGPAWQGCPLARPAQWPWARELGDAATPYVNACGRAGRDAPSEAQTASAEADCRRSIASEVSRMTHETTMKILYNADRGWCYGGEPDCP